MGATVANQSEEHLHNLVEKEFNAKKGRKKDYMVLKEILKLKFLDDLSINMFHLGNLYSLDADKDGRFSLQDFIAFSSLALQQIKKYKPYEVPSQIQAFCTLQLWKEIRTPDQEDDFVAWIGRLLYENQTVKFFEDTPDIPFVKVEAVKLFYEILQMKLTHNIEFQQFFDLLQQVGEENGLMNIENEGQDDYVPMLVLQQFARNFIQAFHKLMNEMGFADIC